MGNFQCFTPTGAMNNPAACSPGAGGPLTPGFVPSEKLTNNGHEWSFGAGVRVGWIGQVHPKITLGAAAASKIYMTEFDDYSELFAEQGSFDIPGNISAGLAFHATPELTIAFDYERIFYGSVKSIANAGAIPTPFGPGFPPGGGLLGQENGLGFGWEDINIYRLGMKYDIKPNWTIRAGYSYNDSPIPDDQILFNVIAPAVNKHHATFGFTFIPSSNSEWTFAYVHAFEEEQKTSRSPFGIPASIGMYQDSLELGYSWKF
jgi:long-chain fatty acid transport protein